MGATGPLPFSEASERNREPILQVLRDLFAERRAVLEIGSGTGQHAAFFAAAMPHLQWYTSDLAENHAGIRAWAAQAGADNLHPPLTLDVTQSDWRAPAVDAVYSANTAHIMHWPMVEALFAGVGRLLPAAGVFALYGPFSYGGRHTSDSNARFDTMLRARDPGMGIRDIDDLQRLADGAGLAPRDDFPMPANNRILGWTRTV